MSSALIKVILGPRRAGKSVFALMLLKNQNFAYFNLTTSHCRRRKNKSRWTYVGTQTNIWRYKYIYLTRYKTCQTGTFRQSSASRRIQFGIDRVKRKSSFHGARHASDRQTYSDRNTAVDFKEILKTKQYEFSADKLFIPDEKSKTAGICHRVHDQRRISGDCHKRCGTTRISWCAFWRNSFQRCHKTPQGSFSKQVDNLGSYLINNISSQYTARKLANVLAFKSDVTVAKYLDYLTESYLLFSLDRHSTKAGMRAQSPKKTYVVDNGLATAKAVQHSPNSGKLMENLVFTELVKRGSQPNRIYFITRPATTEK